MFGALTVGAFWVRPVFLFGVASAPVLVDGTPSVEGAPMMEVRPTPAEEPSPFVTPAAPVLFSPTGAPTMGAEPVAELRRRNLEMPVLGAQREALHQTFDQARGSSRKHDAIDMLAPRGTPVVAVEDGTIAKLFFSDAGGITVYLFDPTEAYCYYYAHLDRYAAGLEEGARVRRGEVLGYVGVTGNAPKDTPHLHFAIFKLTETRQWWKGTPIDPFVVMR
ncbi:MAG TPA: M23 family metallopeptidase [Vicinamibacterales bacterium]|nr:M23 family metallopeptidase [Vicinamibacterales bacterium]